MCASGTDRYALDVLKKKIGLPFRTEQIRDVKGVIFSHKTFDIKILQIPGFVFTEAEFPEVYYALRGMAFITRNADFFFGYMTVEEMQFFISAGT